MVRKLLAERSISKEILKTPMTRAWKPTRWVSFKTHGLNLYLIDFENLWDKDRILEGRPWTFDGYLFALVDFDGFTSVEDLEFKKVAFWVRMFHLPLACMGKDVGWQIGATVGKVEDMDVLDDGVGWGKYLQVKIHIDLSKPLARGRIIKIQNKDHWIAFKYEKLPRFCFPCGMVLHDNGKCRYNSARKSQRLEEAVEYRPWLRIMSPKRCFNHGGGWHRGAKQESRETKGTHSPQRSQSWSMEEESSDGGWRNQRDVGARVQGEDGLFVHGSHLPTMETDEEGRHEMGDSRVNAGSLKGKAMKSNMKEG
jgi:hypothetical protein